MFSAPSKSRMSAKILIMGVSKISHRIQIKINIPNPSQERPASSKAQNEDFKGMDILCNFKIMIENQNLEHGCIKHHWSYPNQGQDPKPQSGTSSILQIPKSGIKGHGCSLHLQNQDRSLKFIILLYQRPVNISKSRSRSQTPVRNIQHPPKTYIRTEQT